MEVQQHHAHLFRHLGQDAVCRMPGAVHRPHEYPAQQTEHRHRHSVGRRHHGQFGSGGLGRKVGRFDDAVFAAERGQDFLTAVDMVAHGNAVHAALAQLVVDSRGDAGPAGGVLGVGHHQVQLFLLDEPGQGAAYYFPPRLAHDVADKQDVHRRVLWLGGYLATSENRASRMTVTLISPG